MQYNEALYIYAVKLKDGDAAITSLVKCTL